MATLHLMVGLPCSGKTTLARELEITLPALRLTTDDWHIRFFGRDFGDDMDESAEALHGARHAAVESVMWELAARVLVLGVDVILDFGCWVRSQRDHYRSKARQVGADFRIHYTAVSDDVLVERLKTRNARLTETSFYIPESKLREWTHLFEPPSPAELE